MLRAGFACCEFGCANPFDQHTFGQYTFDQYTCGDSAPFFCPGYKSCGDWPIHFAASDESVVCKPLENCPSPRLSHRQNPDSNNSARCLPTENRSRPRTNTGKSPRNNTISAQTQF